MTRLLLDEMLVSVFVTGITQALFERFLLGDFAMEFLITICITIVVIIWKDMPLGPEPWIHCYGVPVVVRYGPLSHHYGIAIPKQHPYRPYHSLSLAHEYVELDRAARVIIEVARKVISAAPPPPTDETRDMYMVGLRLYIVEEAVKQGYWQKLETAKIKCKARQAAFFHCKTTSTEKRIARDGPEAQASRKESRVEGGKAAAESRKSSAIRAKGSKASQERIDWVKDVVNDLRRKFESGKTVGLLGCPRNLVHGTLEHAGWLLHRVNEGRDVINSASGFDKLETPKTEEDKESRAVRQDAAGAAGMSSNLRECTALEALKLLATNVLNGTGARKAVELAQCPHCQSTWLIHDGTGQATHTCMVMRSYALPMLFADHQKRLRQQKVDKDIEADENATEEDLRTVSVTRASFTLVLPWELYKDISEEADWAYICTNVPIPTKRPKRTFNLKDPLWMRCLDRAGRLSRLCLTFTKISTSGQLLSLPISKEFFDKDDNPKPVAGIQFVELKDIIKEHSKTLINLGVESAKLASASKSPAHQKVFLPMKKRSSLSLSNAQNACRLSASSR